MINSKERLLSKKWGVFNHYLAGMQNGNASFRNSKGISTSWNDAVNEFDVELLAKNLYEIGAGYYFITLMQGSRYICALNSTYDKICGSNPGEACSIRDLPMDIADALAKYDIDLYLYYTGDGPHNDPEFGPKIGMSEPRGVVTERFLENWSSVLREFSVRYGDKIKGWWIDGCYDFLGYNEQTLKYYYDAVKAGNPNAIVAFNKSGTNGMMPSCSYEDFTAGEQLNFDKVPVSRFIDGVQTHLLIPLGVVPPNITVNANSNNLWNAGHTWCMPGLKRSKEHVLNFVRTANKIGTPVSIDIMLYRNGSFDDEQKECLKYVSENL